MEPEEPFHTRSDKSAVKMSVPDIMCEEQTFSEL